MRGQRRPERMLTDLTRMRSKTTTSLIGMRISIGMPSGAVAVLRQKNVRAAEAIGTRNTSRLSQMRQRRWYRMKR